MDGMVRVEGGGIESAISGARHVRASGENHGGNGPPGRKEAMKKPQNNRKPDSQTALAKPETDAKQADQRIKRTGPNTIEVAVGGVDNFLKILCASTGTSREVVAIRIAQQIGTSFVISKPPDADRALIQAISTLAEIAPQNVTESMLAAQMIATHEAALGFMLSATRDDQTFEGRDANVLRATRLMRLHLDQIEAMQKLKGKAGQQKVTVEHVHVYQGGQAIVGAVAPTGTGVGGDETENR
jgi:hypothetical protein